MPFLDVGPAAAYDYLWRSSDGRVFSRQFPVDELHAFGVIAEEMGFDRGELLTNVWRLLFVEGRSDQEFLEILLGSELRWLGVAVIPMHGVGRLHRVDEAEALFRYTAAAIRILVDNDIAPLLPALRADPDKREAAFRDAKSTELQAVAQLMKTAAKADRDAGLKVLSIPARTCLIGTGPKMAAWREFGAWVRQHLPPES